MSDLFRCVICDHVYYDFGVVVFNRKYGTCLCRRCVNSAIVDIVDRYHLTLFDFVSIVSDQELDQEG